MYVCMYECMYVCVAVAMNRPPDSPVDIMAEFEEAAASARERQREWVSEVLKREKKKRNVK